MFAINKWQKRTGRELKNFKPSLEVEEAEQAIYNHELTDMTDVLKEMMQELKHNM